VALPNWPSRLSGSRRPPKQKDQEQLPGTERSVSTGRLPTEDDHQQWTATDCPSMESLAQRGSTGHPLPDKEHQQARPAQCTSSGSLPPTLSSVHPLEKKGMPQLQLEDYASAASPTPTAWTASPSTWTGGLPRAIATAPPPMGAALARRAGPSPSSTREGVTSGERGDHLQLHHLRSPTIEHTQLRSESYRDLDLHKLARSAYNQQPLHPSPCNP
jgi:hypothetical protein